MAAFGYPANASQTTPTPLAEVTFQITPDELRRLSAFLTSCAVAIENGEMVNGHRHLGDVDGRWDPDMIGFDVIVAGTE